MKRTITFKGTTVTLTGRPIAEGGSFRESILTTTDFEEKKLSAYTGDIMVITTFLSLDTPVCDLQVKEFNKRATTIANNDVIVLGISNDLPFAQKRFCEMNSIDHVVPLSDFKIGSFGINYGLLIKEMSLLARSILIIDKGGVVRYYQIVDEASHAPDYDAALRALEAVIQQPGGPALQATERCTPCEKGTPPLKREEREAALVDVPEWELIDEKKIRKEFTFKTFADAKSFVDMLAVIAEEQGHHPAMTINYNKVRVTCTTHAAGGLTRNDFVLAAIIDEIGGAR